MKRFFTIVATMLCILSANAQHGEYVGGDISDLPLYEEHNLPYLDGKGNKIDDLLVWLKEECGWNTFRVRLFVNPNGTAKDASGKSYTDPSVAQNLDMVKELGKRIKDAGAKFMLDFHYSDSWADPTKQFTPASWSDCTTADAKATRLYNYTKETLATLKAYGATPDLVQVGNEITSKIVDVVSYTTGFKTIVENGCTAVREECPDAKIVLHIERPQNTDNVVKFYNQFDQSKYDIIGLSYYPFWHGYIAALQTTLYSLEQNFPTKKVHIVETGYNFEYWPSSGVSYDTRTKWANTPAGQYAFIKDLLAGLKLRSNVNGLFYWFPEEAGNGDNPDKSVLTDWVNRGLWWPGTGLINGSTTEYGHWPVSCNDGMVCYLMKSFLKQETAINEVQGTVNRASSTVNRTYNLAGQQVDNSYKGIVIKNGKKVMQ